MRLTNPLNFSATQLETQPFPHFCAANVLAPALERGLHEWLANAATWELTTTDFYEQYEFSLLHIELPAHLRCLVEGELPRQAIAEMERAFHVSGLEMVSATIHKLTNGQRIGVHNDFIGVDESHRLIIQVNEGWTEANGGYLMLFNSSDAEDVSQLVLPVSNSAFAFAISADSHHAVSTVYDFTRYTLVYTFKQHDEQYLLKQIAAYLKSPFVGCDANLSGTLAEAGQQWLRDATGITTKNYSIANCLYPTTIIAESLEASRGLPLVEVPDMDRLTSFYEEHGLKPLSYDELIANQAAEKLHAAWQLLASVPSVLASIQALVKTIQVVHSPDLEVDISYSHPDIPFSVFVSVGEDISLISSLRVAESILHEAMHLQLTLLEAQLPLVQPDSHATFYSPWREEARPVRGVLHGLYVFRVIHDFYESLPAPPLATELAPFVANRLATIREELAEITSFGTAAGLTDAGQHLVRSLLDVEAA